MTDRPDENRSKSHTNKRFGILRRKLWMIRRAVGLNKGALKSS